MCVLFSCPALSSAAFLTERKRGLRCLPSTPNPVLRHFFARASCRTGRQRISKKPRVRKNRTGIIFRRYTSVDRADSRNLSAKTASKAGGLSYLHLVFTNAITSSFFSIVFLSVSNSFSVFHAYCFSPKSKVPQSMV